MSIEPATNKAHLLSLTTDIIVARLSSTYVAPDNLAQLIRDVYAALAVPGSPTQSQAPTTQPVPAVPVRKSVYPDYIVCLEDGKKLKMLKRHLKSTYGMTPEQYREKWGLPVDYPLVAPNYAKRRSALAREIGLGRTIGSTVTGGKRASRTPEAKGDDGTTASA
ncbi:MucR family transcriptional regulator [Formicincola oecophyllae]|uniref:MucR family transcriptional regulator n=1 Tax=Formicincola oecophyllae TaxID=2558361 RepID=A0A4Y6U6K4_9PROT|nr:MucR family transcriptional regulator [Formicincola oecophyllae]QDH12989.1 MucR family transcriptional regulator [Formicincola oecophyllae]